MTLTPPFRGYYPGNCHREKGMMWAVMRRGITWLSERAGLRTSLYLVAITGSLAGCGYPNSKIHKLDTLVFKDKRENAEEIHILDFVKPEDTAGVLDKLELKNFSQDEEENIVLNILDYVQKLELINDRKDFWQYPEETIKKGGDCEDKTFLLMSILIKKGISDVRGVKGRYFGNGHMWVEYKEYILDPVKTKAKLIPINKSIGYVPYFKFGQDGIYYCQKETQ